MQDEKTQTPQETGAAGGQKRAANMTKRERIAAARKAAQARWDKVRQEKLNKEL